MRKEGLHRSKNRKWKRLACFVAVVTIIFTMIPVTDARAATTLNASDIVNRLNGLVGTTNSNRAGYCLGWVFDQYKALGATNAKIGKNCNCAYEAGTVLVQSTSRSNIPTGALVFFAGISSQGKCKSCGKYYGHVGIYVGDDYIVSIRSNGKIKKEKISDWTSWGYAYRGWGMPKNVSINQNTATDTTPPTISNVRITDQDANGYTVTVDATDSSGIDRVQFPTWTEANGQDDIASDWGTNTSVRGSRNGNTYTFRVNRTEHNNELSNYVTHIYAYDVYGNYASAGVGVPSLIGDKQNIGTDFLAVIQNKSTQTVLTKESDNNVTGRTYIGSENQLWLFTRKSNGTYKIASAADKSLCLDVNGASDNDGTNVWVYSDNNTIAQEWKIYKDKGGYVLVPNCSDSKSLDLYNGSAAEGTNIQIWQYWGGNPSVFSIEIKNPVVNISNTSLSLQEGETKTISASVYPDVFKNGVTWSTSDSSIATVDNGTITARKEGTVTITASSKTNSALKANCTVTIQGKKESASSVQSSDVSQSGGASSQSNCSVNKGGAIKKDSGINYGSDSVNNKVTPDTTQNVQKPNTSDNNNVPKQKSKVVQGKTYTAASAKYKVTSIKKKTVTYMKPIKKSRNVTIPDTVTIKGTTFKVTEVAAKAFYKDTKIISVSVGQNVKKIGKNAFRKCTNLNHVTLEGTKITSIGTHAFKDISNCWRVCYPTSKQKKYLKLWYRALK